MVPLTPKFLTSYPLPSNSCCRVERVAGHRGTAATLGIKGKSGGDAVPHTGNFQQWDFMANCIGGPSQKDDLQQVHWVLPTTEGVLSQLATSAPTRPQLCNRGALIIGIYQKSGWGGYITYQTRRTLRTSLATYLGSYITALDVHSCCCHGRLKAGARNYSEQ